MQDFLARAAPPTHALPPAVSTFVSTFVPPVALPAVETVDPPVAAGPWSNPTETHRALAQPQRSYRSVATAVGTTAVKSTAVKSTAEKPSSYSTGRQPVVERPLTVRAVVGSAPPERREICLPGNITLEALSIPPEVVDAREISQLVSTPQLYYIAGWEHFALRIGALFLHGSIGRIYTSEKERSPGRVKECRRGPACPRRGVGCQYYHDPALCPGSRDARNFMADAWLYTSSVGGRGYSARYGSRRFGSYEYLEVDLRNMSPCDARRFLDQTAHDLLCAIVLSKYKAC